MASTELRKHARQIGWHAAALHMRRAIHATVLVLAKIIPFAAMGVRKHSVGFSNQLELFFIAALEPQKSHIHPYYQQHRQKRAVGRGRPHLVWMMFERFTPIRFFDVCLVTISRDTEDLIIILRLAPLKRSFSTLKFATQRAHVAVRALKLGLLERGAEIRYCVVVFFLVQLDACPRA
jgi:hypothetical protein